MSRQHIVKEGDCISSIAFRYGFHPEKIWNDPQNAELRQLRREGTVLKKGDAVFVPEQTLKTLPIVTEAQHVFRRRAVPEMLQIRFLDENDQPRAGYRYALSIDGDRRDGQTDREGFLKAPIPPNAVRGKLILFIDETQGESEEYDFTLGTLQPITEFAGVQTRLKHLGYLIGNEPGEPEDSMATAIRRFQADQRLEVTGNIDANTRHKIQEIYGA